jgi:hypothetical protein
VGLSSFVAKKETLTADMYWTTKAITSHYSNKSCNNIGNIFQFMFHCNSFEIQFQTSHKSVLMYDDPRKGRQISRLNRKGIAKH